MKKYFSLLILCLCLPTLASADYRYYQNLPLHVSAQSVISIHNTQNIFHFIDSKTENKRLITEAQQLRDYHAFLDRLFSPWRKRLSYLAAEQMRQVALSEKVAYQHALGYGENFHQHRKVWFDEIANNMNLAKFPSHDEKAIAVNNAYIRLFPTMVPHFGANHDAGSGYPFDDFQVSVLWAGTPVRVLHLSKDSAWAFVLTPSVTGWVQVSALASVSNQFMSKWEDAAFVAITKREIAIKDVNGHYRFDAYMGSVFPLVKPAKGGFEILVPVKDGDNNARTVSVVLSNSEAAPMPWAATPLHFATLIHELLGEPYGWGGLYFYGDCSSTMKSLFAPFGIWLPRNSASQAQSSRNVSLSNLNPVERQAAILKQAKPFTTLISVTGHIMLYIGDYHGEPMTFQNLWAFATMSRSGKLGRSIVGRAVLLPLQLSYGKTGMFPQIDGQNLRLTFF